jgi:opacity protein-like surface antigen
MKFQAKMLLSVAALVAFAPAAYANDISPYTPAEGSGEAEISYTRQEADTFNPGDAQAPLPRELSQDSILLTLSYGISQRFAADVKIGYAKTSFLTDPMLAPEGGLDGLNDVFIGLRYKALDEAEGAPFTATLGVAGIIDGGYRTGALPAIGDGGSGGQVALALGRSIGPFSLSGDVGYRTRSNNIPDEVFGAINASISPTSGISLYGGVSFVDSTSGIDIGGPGFSPARFPEVEEDYKIWSLGASASLSDRISANISYGKKFDGRNTARSEFFRIGLGYSF